MSQSVLVRTPNTAVVTVVEARSVVVTPPQPFSSVVVRGVPGPRGPQGAPGPAGGTAVVTVGATPLSGHTAVAMDAGGLLIYADCTNQTHIGAVQGVIANAYGAGDPAVVQTDFDLTHAGWAFATGPVFVGAAGALVQTLPVGAVFAQVVGYALAPTRIRVDVQPPIVLT